METRRESKGSTDISNQKIYWWGYGAQLLTVFLALAIVAGRIYTQRYWNVFALAPDLSDIQFINYAVISIDTTVASMFIAVGTTAITIIFFRQQPYDIVGGLNPRVVYSIGFVLFLVGSVGAGLITEADLSSWASGTVGLVFGVAYLFSLIGAVIYAEAVLKLQKKPPKWSKVFDWLRQIPPNSVRSFFVALIAIVSLWGIFAIAWQFGANEAKFMYNTKPYVSIQLDSPAGFEDLVSTNSQGVAFLRVKIITEDGGLLYVSPGITKSPQKLYIRAIPVSRVQSIRYEIDVLPIGK